MNPHSQRIRRVLYVALFASLTVALSFVRIPLPFSPVPITGQTLGSMMAGMFLGARLGASSQFVYLLMGLTGLPVFGGLGGPQVLVGPTGGYVIGMIAGAAVVGWLTERTRGLWPWLLSAWVGGAWVVYLPGVTWLSHVMGISWMQAFWVGAVPYLLGDALKALVAVLAARRLRRFRWREGDFKA